MLRRSVSVAVLALLVSVGTAQAQSQSLGDYDGPASAGPFPLAPVFLGTFATGTGVTSATISGTYGTAIVPSSTAGFDLFLDGILVAQCLDQDPGCWQGGPDFRPWSYTLGAAELSIFADGMADLTIVQTSESVIRLGDPTLTWTTSVPEPASVLLLATGVLGLVARRRKSDLEG